MSEITTPDDGRHLLLEAVAGTAIGLLIGVLTGLSVSPTAATVVGALAAILAAFLGFKEPVGVAGATSALIPIRTGAVRAASFGTSCLIALLLALIVRTNGLLTTSIETQVATWTRAGYSPEEARRLVAFRALGVLPSGWSYVENLSTRASSSVLFSSDAQGRCGDLRRANFANTAARLRTFELAGGPWQALAESVGRLPQKDQEAILEAAWAVACR